MVKETQSLLLSYDRLVAPAKQVLQGKPPVDSAGDPIDDGNAGNPRRGHQFSSPAAGAVGIGEKFR